MTSGYMSESDYTNNFIRQTAQGIVEHLLPDDWFYYQEVKDV